MPIPQTKDELQLAIRESYAKLRLDLSRIPSSQTRIPDLEGHARNTTMSLHNLLAYLVGWGQLVLKWNHLKTLGQSVDFPETGYKWNELGSLAQKFYQDYEEETFESLLAHIERTTLEILDLVESKTNTELYETAWYEKWTLGRMIQLNTAAPFKNARSRIRKWKKEKGF